MFNALLSPLSLLHIRYEGIRNQSVSFSFLDFAFTSLNCAQLVFSVPTTSTRTTSNSLCHVSIWKIEISSRTTWSDTIDEQMRKPLHSFFFVESTELLWSPVCVYCKSNIWYVHIEEWWEFWHYHALYYRTKYTLSIFSVFRFSFSFIQQQTNLNGRL